MLLIENFDILMVLNFQWKEIGNVSASDEMPLNQLMPNVQKLVLHLEYENDHSFLDCELPYLRELDITIRDEFWNRTDPIDRLIKKNPNIHKLSIHSLPNNYAKFISESLPELEELFISKFDIGIDELRFENVQRFTLFSANPNSIINLFVPRIEYFWFRCYTPEGFDALNTFFSNHKHLTKLHVGDFAEFDRLTELTAELTNLTELKLQSDLYERNFTVNVDEIARFLEHHQKLTKLQFAFYENMHIDMLRNRFGNEWNIESNGSFLITLERKGTRQLQ